MFLYLGSLHREQESSAGLDAFISGTQKQVMSDIREEII